MKKFSDKHPIFVVSVILAVAFLFLWWMSQPIEVIYDSSGPLYWWDDDGYH